jgi:hypothetical protein
MNHFRKVDWDKETLAKNKYLNPGALGQRNPESVLIDPLNDMYEKIHVELQKTDTGMTYEQSLDRLRSAGYERHLYPDETFEIIKNGLERPEGEYGDLAQDILKGSGEWMNIAIKREGNSLYIGYNPENLEWIAYGYRIKSNKDIKCEYIGTFKIEDHESPFINIQTLEKKDPVLVQCLWGIDAKSALTFIRNAGYDPSSAGLFAINDGIWRPAARGTSGGTHFDIHANDTIRAMSRGVKKVQ